MVWGSCLDCVDMLSGGCDESIWRVWGGCLEGCGGYLESLSRLSGVWGACLEDL